MLNFFTRLPDELVAEIFENISQKDLLKNVTKVDRRFHKIGIDDKVLKNKGLLIYRVGGLRLIVERYRGDLSSSKYTLSVVDKDDHKIQAAGFYLTRQDSFDEIAKAIKEGTEALISLLCSMGSTGAEAARLLQEELDKINQQSSDDKILKNKVLLIYRVGGLRLIVERYQGDLSGSKYTLSVVDKDDHKIQAAGFYLTRQDSFDEIAKAIKEGTEALISLLCSMGFTGTEAAKLLQEELDKINQQSSEENRKRNIM